MVAGPNKWIYLVDYMPVTRLRSMIFAGVGRPLVDGVANVGAVLQHLV